MPRGMSAKSTTGITLANPPVHCPWAVGVIPGVAQVKDMGVPCNIAWATHGSPSIRSTHVKVKTKASLWCATQSSYEQ
jgi:hypothetical protein